MKALKHLCILATLLILTSQYSIIKAQVSDNEAVFGVSGISADTVVKVVKHLYRNNSFTTGKGYFYFDYTNLAQTDGTIQPGTIVEIMGAEKFVPACDAITLSRSTSKVSICDKQVYLFQKTGSDTTWQICVYFDNLPGDKTAFKYTNTTADTGSFAYKIKVIR